MAPFQDDERTENIAWIILFGCKIFKQGYYLGAKDENQKANSFYISYDGSFDLFLIFS